MYGLSVGASRIGESLPRAVYALLSGLNAATVGIIAVAATQLARKAITDQMTRLLVFLGATAGLMYSALWYFPLLIFISGCISILYDYRVFHPAVKWITGLWRRERQPSGDDTIEVPVVTAQATTRDIDSNGIDQNLERAATRNSSASLAQQNGTPSSTSPIDPPEGIRESRVIPPGRTMDISWQFGTAILLIFLCCFITIMVLRSTLRAPLLFSFFSNMFLAGTIIFGGGPVVIPLLREYVVNEGWVSPRDFLIGLAIIQAFPGPNFNFAVYLGGLTAFYGGHNPAAGAVLGFLGIYLPGIITVHGTMGIWSALRGKRWVKSGLRGINSAAVGLIYTAVYRLWQIGFLDLGSEQGKSLGDDPWWVVVCVTSYVGSMWFNVKAPVAILLGAVMGLIWYGVVTT